MEALSKSLKVLQKWNQSLELTETPPQSPECLQCLPSQSPEYLPSQSTHFLTPTRPRNTCSGFLEDSDTTILDSESEPELPNTPDTQQLSSEEEFGTPKVILTPPPNTSETDSPNTPSSKKRPVPSSEYEFVTPPLKRTYLARNAKENTTSNQVGDCSLKQKGRIQPQSHSEGNRRVKTLRSSYVSELSKKR